jgi:hypothetical protein
VAERWAHQTGDTRSLIAMEEVAAIRKKNHIRFGLLQQDFWNLMA